VAFSPDPDGRQIALASDGLVELLDAKATPATLVFPPIHCHGGQVYTVAFSPGGQYLASGGLDRTLRLWDRATGQEIRGFFGHEGFVRGLAFSPDGRWLLSASEDFSLKLWEVASGYNLTDFHGHQGFTNCVAFSPDGQRIASGGQDQAVKLWLATPSSQPIFTEHDGVVSGLAFSPDGRRVVSGSGNFATQGRLIRWDATTARRLLTFPGVSPFVNAVALRRGGRHDAAAYSDGTVRVWDAVTGELVRPLPGHVSNAADVVYSPDGRWLASASGDRFDTMKPGEMKLWDADTGQEIRTFGGHSAGVYGVAFSLDGRWLASACADGTVRIWDTGDPVGKPREMPRHAGEVRRVVFLPNGRLASAGGKSGEFGEVKIRDLSTERALELSGHTGLVWGLAASPDGRRLATGSDDRTIKLWDTTTGEEVLTLRGHTAGVLCVAFSPDGRSLASGSIDRTGRVWSTSQPMGNAPLRREVESLLQVSELPADPFAR
jgi:WD40 repeat protein